VIHFIILIFTSFIFLEFLLRFVKYLRSGKFEIFAIKLDKEKKYLSFQSHTYLGYTKSKNITNPRYPSNNAGFAGSKDVNIRPGKNLNTIRIVVCGDSIVEQNDIDMEPKFDQELTWPKSMETNLNKADKKGNYEVINAGCSGYTVLESTIHLLTKCVPYKPDYAILYQGVNDACCIQAFPDFVPDYTHARRPPVFPTSNGFLHFLPNIRISFIYQYSLLYLKKFLEKPTIVMPYISCKLKYNMTFDQIQTAVETYEDYLRSFCYIALAHNITPILIPLLFNKELITKPYYFIDWDKENFIELLEMNRESIRRIASEIDGAVLLELSDNKKDSFRDKDWLHFSKVGLEKTGKNVATEFLKIHN